MSIYVRAIDGMENHTAADLRAAVGDLVNDAGVVDKDGGGLLVTENGTPDMSVDIAPGIGYVENSSFTAYSSLQKYWDIIVDASVNLAISSNPSGSTRYDLICLKVDTGVSPDANASNVASLVVVEGTPGAGEPSVPNDHLLLATVEVANGETAIENAHITDERVEVSYNIKLVNQLEVVTTLLTKRRREAIYPNGDLGATPTIDFANGATQSGTLDDDATITLSNALIGEYLTLIFYQDGSGGHSITWPANVKVDENIADEPNNIVIPTTANAEFWVGLRAVSPTQWRIVAVSGAMVN